MFSFLDMVNHYLGYFNIGTTLKSRLYTGLGALGDIYLFYISIQFLKNHYYSRGMLILLVAIVLLYFTICNLFFYFTNSQFKLDVSPKLAKLLHLKEKEPEVIQSTSTPYVVTPSNGIFDPQHVLPAKIVIDNQQQTNIDQLVDQLASKNLLVADYQQQSDDNIKRQVIANEKPVYAIGDGVLLPCFEMREVNGQQTIYGGLNQANLNELGQVTKLGLQSIESMDLSKVDLYLASVQIVGGPNKTIGRSDLTEHFDSYQIRVRIAYENKD